MLRPDPGKMPPAPALPPILDEEEALPLAVNDIAQEGLMPEGLRERAEQMRWMQQQYLSRIAGLAREHDAALRSYQPLLKRVATSPEEFRHEDVFKYWEGQFSGRLPLLATLFVSLGALFVDRIVLEDPRALEKVKGRPALYLANHQVAVESVLFSIMSTAWSGVSTMPLSRIEHQSSWLGRLVEFNATHPDVHDPEQIAYFDRQDRASLLSLLEDFRKLMEGGKKSLLVHVEGEQNRCARKPLERMSSLWVDLAISANVPIVPVRFSRALPLEPVSGDLNFPIGYGRMDFHLGRPIWPHELQAMPAPERKGHVIRRLNSVGPSMEHETPSNPNPALESCIKVWQERLGVSEPQAACLATLEHTHALSAEVSAVLEFARGEAPDWGSTPHPQWMEAFARWLCSRC